MRVILAGGGTGGHLFPGLAVAREFQRRDAQMTGNFIYRYRAGDRSAGGAEGRIQTGNTVRQRPEGPGCARRVRCCLRRPRKFVAFVSKSSVEFRPDMHHRVGRLCLRADAACRRRCGEFPAPSWSKICARVLPIKYWRVSSIACLPHTPTAANYFPGAKVMETGNPVRWQSLPRCPRAKNSLCWFSAAAPARAASISR